MYPPDLRSMPSAVCHEADIHRMDRNPRPAVLGKAEVEGVIQNGLRGSDNGGRSKDES